MGPHYSESDELVKQIEWVELNPCPLSVIVLDWKNDDTSNFSEVRYLHCFVSITPNRIFIY